MPEIIAGTYELLNKIGAGGGGVVYLANHMRLGKKVVLKADKRKITTRPEILRREVDALKDLNHTYIPQVYDFFIEGDTVYTVIDYIDGESMDKPLKRNERFTQPQVIKWAIQLLEALCYLHNPVHGTPPRGIVHSDIKPANIMLTTQNDIRLIDFNIALALGEENVVGLSAGYASPEHYGLDFSTDTTFTNGTNSKSYTKKETVKGNLKEDKTETMADLTATMDKEKVIMSMKPSEMSNSSTSLKRIVIPDARSDIYSLGATLYHFLSGKRPAKRALDVVPLSEKEFSPLIVKIISKAMNPNPDLRYQTAEEMLYDFTHLRENDPRTKKRKKIFIGMSIAFSVVIVSSTFISFVGLKRMEALQKALTFAEASQNALQSENKELAVKCALEALPEENLFTPKYTSQAKKALADSLGLYDLSDGYKISHMLEIPSEVFKIKLSPSGKTGAVVYSFSLALFDTETGKITDELPIVKSALSDVKFIDDNTIVYAGEEGITMYDNKEHKKIWTGKPATHIAVSADGQTVAGIYRDDDFAVIYDCKGNEKSIVSFNGSKQRVAENDTFADPMDNIMALNKNGQYLAVSFENGGLRIFDTTNPENDIELYDESEFNHFEGGFNGDYFAFSATKEGLSAFDVIDIAKLEEVGGFNLDSKIGVKADENGIFLSNKSTVVALEPLSGKQTELAYADSYVKCFSSDNGNTIAVTEKNEYLFYDSSADLITRHNEGQTEYSFVDIAGDCAVVTGRDTPNIKILHKKSYEDKSICSYDKSYAYEEARVNEAEERLMLFSINGFRIYDFDNNLIKEVSIPDPQKIYDQQYSKKSGNLAVIYKDAFRLYSGITGECLFEKTDLKSVTYANYGVSILDSENNLQLIDLDTAEILESGKAKGDYALYCGFIADKDFLGDSQVIGASKTSKGYVFASVNNNICTVYDGEKRKKCEIPISDKWEAFFTDNAIILSPLHGTPIVYDLNSGKKIAELEKDAYLTYVTQIDDYIISQYVSSTKDKYAVLLSKDTFEPLAYLPSLTDISEGELVFDYHKGELRKIRIYPINELINIAKEGDNY